ncbi:MAG: nicotinate phosphoribosyltransferase [Oscillospiraceae bacterium]|nr:nicotinate phosphoribosyltransferase [Oscillospiraceae bacterium]
MENRFSVKDPRNLSILTDFYELTMANGVFKSPLRDVVCVYDVFFRKVPDNGGFAIFCGLEQAIEYLENLSFTQNDIEYLRSRGIFSEEFLAYLADFKFECNVWAMPEGTPVFPKEPMFVIEGPAVQAQLLETALLVLMNHQTLIATKANRIVRSAMGRPVQEFGARRAQGVDGANYGTRASYIGGCVSSSNTMMERDMGIPASGTMAHAWVQMFDSEYEAFRTFAQVYPDSTVLLVDTYNVLKSGVPNAIRVFDEVLKPLGKRPKGIRIDSGDIAYLSKQARIMLDAAGYTDCPIIASNSLDEYIIRDLLINDAKIDSFGVGECMITSKTTPVLGGVYKLVAIKEEDGSYTPKIKISASSEKTTLPYRKQVYRIFDNKTGMAMADYITICDEEVDLTPQEMTIFSPLQPWKRQTLRDITLRPMLVPIFEKGKLVYSTPSIKEIKAFCQQQLETLWDELKRLEYPHIYYVDYSEKLWLEQMRLLSENQDGNKTK